MCETIDVSPPPLSQGPKLDPNTTSQTQGIEPRPAAGISLHTMRPGSIALCTTLMSDVSLCDLIRVAKMNRTDAEKNISWS